MKCATTKRLLLAVGWAERSESHHAWKTRGRWWDSLRSAHPTHSRSGRPGFSLLEVILAMAVLAGAVAVLGEAASMSMRNAQYTRDMSRAQAFCESTLDEIIAGYIPSDPVQAMPVDSSAMDTSSGTSADTDASGTGWLYSIDQQSVDDETGLLAVRVTVTQDLQPQQRPVSFSLTRWIADPNAATTGSDASTSQSGSSGSTAIGGSP